MASTTFTAYVPIRALSGLFSPGVTTAPAKKNWRPHAGVPIGYIDNDESKPVYVNPSWGRHIADLGQRKLGGSSYPTLPDLASFVTQAQVDAQLSAAQDQWTAANAQALQALIQVVQSAGLAGASAIPGAVLARQETNPQPVSTLPDSPGGGD